jgi:predicted GIY-YIG superfamily endonuclease
MATKYFGCYLLRSLRIARYYIGFTTHPMRRIRQHNGEISAGAKKTRRLRPWEMLVFVYGFPTKVAALQFEWAWQHPTRSKRVREALANSAAEAAAVAAAAAAAAKPKSRAAAAKKAASKARFAPGICGQLQLLHEMLNIAPWSQFPLCVHVLSQSDLAHLAQCRPLPPHMRITSGALTQLPHYQKGASIAELDELDKEEDENESDEDDDEGGGAELHSLSDADDEGSVDVLTSSLSALSAVAASQPARSMSQQCGDALANRLASLDISGSGQTSIFATSAVSASLPVLSAVKAPHKQCSRASAATKKSSSRLSPGASKASFSTSAANSAFFSSSAAASHAWASSSSSSASASASVSDSCHNYLQQYRPSSNSRDDGIRFDDETDSDSDQFIADDDDDDDDDNDGGGASLPLFENSNDQPTGDTDELLMQLVLIESAEMAAATLAAAAAAEKTFAASSCNPASQSASKKYSRKTKKAADSAAPSNHSSSSSSSFPSSASMHCSQCLIVDPMLCTVQCAECRTSNHLVCLAKRHLQQQPPPPPPQLDAPDNAEKQPSLSAALLALRLKTAASLAPGVAAEKSSAASSSSSSSFAFGSSSVPSSQRRLAPDASDAVKCTNPQCTHVEYWAQMVQRTLPEE